MLSSFFSYVILLFISICFHFSCLGSAHGKVESNFHDNFDCIDIISDDLVVDINSNIADFIGNIRLFSSSGTLESDSLRVCAQTSDDCSLFVVDAFHEVIAKGSVKIKFDNKIVAADCAKYLVKDKILTLTGSNVSINYGDDIAYGSKFVFHLALDE